MYHSKLRRLGPLPAKAGPLAAWFLHPPHPANLKRFCALQTPWLRAKELRHQTTREPD